MPRPVRSTRSPKDQFRQGGTPSVFTCPDCQGTLFLLSDNGLIRYRCRIGHVYSPESMLEAQDEKVERLMWSAARALEEQAQYITELAGELGKHDHTHRAGIQHA